MNNNEVEKFKQRYKNLLGCKKEIIEYIERKKELEETSQVMEYLRICEIIESGKDYPFYGTEKMTDDEILDKVIDEFQVEEDNGIYTLIGEDQDKKTKKFKNIETAIVRDIKNEDINEFEEKNIVMYPSEEYNKDDFYKKMRREYYKKIINNYSDRRAKQHAKRRSYLFKRKTN